MTVMFYDSAETPAQTSTPGWTQRAAKQGNLNARKHWVWVYAEYGGAQTDRAVGIRVLINNVEVASDYHTPEVSDEYKSFMTMVEVEPQVDDTPYTVALEYGFAAGPQTALVRRVRLMVMQE